VEIKPYAQLIAPDPRNSRFGFMAARVGGGFDVEVAAQVVQGRVSYIQISSDVPETLVASLDRVRRIFSYGLFDYELFTAAREAAILLLEQALRERFVTLYGGVITLVNVKADKEQHLQVSHFDAVYDALNAGVARQR
jgi:hypothetical protein